MHVKTWLAGFFVAAVIAGFAPVKSLAQETAQPAQAAPCTPVARLFGKTVCRENITAEETHLQAIKQQYEQQGLDSEQALKSRNLDRLKDELWSIALLEKFGPGKLDPTEEEIYVFSKAFKESLRRSHEDNLKNAAKIRDFLAHRTYTPEEERKLKNLLSTIETSIAFYSERQKHHETMPPEFGEMIAEAERGIAESMIRDWKTNKALYEAYGGALVLQQGVVIPAGAYNRFIAYIREEGGLAILDPAYEGVFAATALTGGEGNAMSAEDEALYKEFFSSPYWQLENSAALARENLEN